MFDIGFSELLLVLVIGLIVLGPQRLPVAVKTVAGWIRALRSLAASVQHELSQELKLQELQDSLEKAKEAGLQSLTPELKASMNELEEAAESLQRVYHSGAQEERAYNPQMSDPQATHDGVISKEMASSTVAEVEPVASPSASAAKIPASHQPNSEY